MPSQTSIIFLGATGAVGGVAWSHLLANSALSQISILARREFVLPERDKEKRHVVDTMNPKTYAHLLASHDTAICTMGVGEPSKVSKEEFKRIDHDAVLAFAVACRAAGVKHFVLLGSVGSDPASRSFYLQSKGALRNAINALGFKSVTTFQPSMILTPANRYGLSQAIMLAVWPIVSVALIGPLSKFRGVKIEVLGKAIAQAALSPPAGNTMLHWSDIQRLASPA